MNENKEYVTCADYGGSINISEEVVAAIAAGAVNEVENVVPYTRSELIGKRSVSKGVKIHIDENNMITADLFIAVTMGTIVSDAARAVQISVRDAIESTTGLKVLAVNVHVGAVIRK